MIMDIKLSFLFNVILLSVLAPLGLFILLVLVLRVLSLKKFFSTDVVTALSTGLLMSLTFIHYIPHSLENNQPLHFSVTVLIGLGILLLIESYVIPKLGFINVLFPALQSKESSSCSHYHQHHNHPFAHGSSFSAIGCLLICSLFDGFRLGSALFIDASVTYAATAAIFMHILPEGLVVALLAYRSALPKKVCYLLMAVFCMFLGQGIWLVGLFRLALSESLILSLSTGSLLYIIFVHLLPIAGKKENQKWLFLSLLGSAFVLYFAH